MVVMDPNPLLVRETERLAPGTALDLGCGEGGDAIWLAQRGWRVTGVDLSQTALDQARKHAADAGVELAFQRCDLGVTFPEGEFDLVSAQFLHFPLDRDRERNRILRRATQAVAHGGYLVIGGHAETPSWSEYLDCDFPTTKNVLDHLGLMDNWIIITNEVVRREVAGPLGQLETCGDSVLTLKRLF